MKAVWIVIGVIVLALIGSIFIFASNKEPEPKDIYLQYHKEFDNAQNFDELLSVMKKYASEEYLVAIGILEAFTSQFKDATFALLKLAATKSSEFTTIEQTISEDRATLIVHTKNPNVKGNVVMVKEDGVWKIKEDSWEGKEDLLESES